MAGMLGLKAWQWLFILEALPTVLLSGVVLCCLTDRPKDARWLSAEERAWLEGELDRESRAIGGAHGKEVWLTEMQAQPWASDPGDFTTSDLLVSAKVYRNAPLQVVLLWGVETWLADPAWMDAAAQAMGILRTPSAVPAPSR